MFQLAALLAMFSLSGAGLLGCEGQRPAVIGTGELPWRDHSKQKKFTRNQ
jgi:hypothetical protein